MLNVDPFSVRYKHFFVKTLPDLRAAVEAARGIGTLILKLVQAGSLRSVLPSHPRWHAFRREHSPSCKRHLDLSQDCALGEAHPIGETLNLETLILVEACDALLLAHES